MAMSRGKGSAGRGKGGSGLTGAFMADDVHQPRNQDYIPWTQTAEQLSQRTQQEISIRDRGYKDAAKKLDLIAMDIIGGRAEDMEAKNIEYDQACCDLWRMVFLGDAVELEETYRVEYQSKHFFVP